MKTDNLISETLKVPQDMLMDVLQIVVHEDIKNQITGLVPNRSTLIFELTYETNLVRKHKALSLIKDLIDRYLKYRTWEDEELNWRAD